MATFVVETGAGLSNANSFVSVAVADAYVDDHTQNAAWTALVGSSVKEKHLRLATQYISTNWNNRWKGTKANGTQALPWPRYAVIVDGYYIDGTVVPTAVIHATCEAALRSLAGDTLIPDYEAGAAGSISDNRVKIGPLEFETAYGSSSSPGKTYNIINEMLRSLTYAGEEIIRG